MNILISSVGYWTAANVPSMRSLWSSQRRLWIASVVAVFGFQTEAFLETQTNIESCLELSLSQEVLYKNE